MKVKVLVFILISVTAVVVIIGGCATTRKAVPDEAFFETWSGTWVNTDFPGSHVAPQKIVTHPDGTLDYYSSAANPNCGCQRPFVRTLAQGLPASSIPDSDGAQLLDPDCSTNPNRSGSIDRSGRAL